MTDPLCLHSLQESYTTEESLNPSGNFDSQKTARITELERLLEAHQQEISTLSEQVSHWRGLVERYGGNTTEIVNLEEREQEQARDGGKVGESIEELLRLNEELREGELSSVLLFPLHDSEN